MLLKFQPSGYGFCLPMWDPSQVGIKSLWRTFSITSVIQITCRLLKLIFYLNFSHFFPSTSQMDIQSANDQAQQILSNWMGIRGFQIFPQDAMQDPFPGKISFFWGVLGTCQASLRKAAAGAETFSTSGFCQAKSWLEILFFYSKWLKHLDRSLIKRQVEKAIIILWIQSK